MTSVPGVIPGTNNGPGNIGWSCGISYILTELGRLAELEYPTYSPWSESPPKSVRAEKPAAITTPGSEASRAKYPAASSSSPSSPPAPPPQAPPQRTEEGLDMRLPTLLPNLPALPLPAILRPSLLRKQTPSSSSSSSSPHFRALSRTGPTLASWTGRKPDEHAVNRKDEKDVQSHASQQGMREKEGGKSESWGIAGQGGEENRQAEREKPEAPKPVIGMNDERGSKGH